jgi:hypothetical protein
MSKEKGSCFKLEYERCHEDKNEHFALAAMIGYILSFRFNKIKMRRLWAHSLLETLLTLRLTQGYFRDDGSILGRITVNTSKLQCVNDTSTSHCNRHIRQQTEGFVNSNSPTYSNF